MRDYEFGEAVDAEDWDTLRSHGWEVPTLPGMRALVGWHGAWGSYWAEIFHVDGKIGPYGTATHLTLGGPLDGAISNLMELLDMTWWEIMWDEDEGDVMRKLKDQPEVEYLSYAEAEMRPVKIEIEDYYWNRIDAISPDAPDVPGKPKDQEPTAAPPPARPAAQRFLNRLRRPS